MPVQVLAYGLLSRAVSGMAATLVLSDISETVAAGERLQHQATHDALTGLPNRPLLQDRIERSITAAQRAGDTVAVLFIDLDDFKRINDSFGHHFGDRVLCMVASRLKSACRAMDTVGRWGGDEFVVVLNGLSSDHAIESITRKILSMLSEPMAVDDMVFHLSGTIGISRAPEDSSNPDELLGMADTAMYQVKQRGGNNFGFVSTDMLRLSRHRLEIESGLRNALKSGELQVYYQPQIKMEDQTLTGFEALLRWNRSGFGLCMPDEFIAIAEESDLILQIGQWVFDEVGWQIRQWQDEGLAVVPVAVNIPAKHCLAGNLLETVSSTLERHGIAPHLIELEITETTAMQDMNLIESLTAQLKAIGVNVALDDFGTGYSSLAHLRRLPISMLKIDKSFILEATQESDDAAIIRAIIALAHNLGLKVVGEGVETLSQHDFLALQACDIAQGYFHGRPGDADSAHRLLVEKSAST